MTNTKNLTREQRKAEKKKARRGLKEKWRGLSYKERKEYRKARKSDKKNFTTWLREKEAEGKEKAEEPPKEPGQA